MRYQPFLFTRNQRRDFTAFIRPAEMTNKDVSLLANAFNHVNDITPLSPQEPALYTFPLGAYVFVLRHFNSGRTHSGRAIPVIEGIAVPHADADALADALPRLLGAQADLLRVADGVTDIETIEITIADEREWDEDDETVEDVLIKLSDQDLTQDAPEPETRPLTSDYAARYAGERLFVPFRAEGLARVAVTLADPDLPRLNVAFGTNADVATTLEASGFSFDILGYLTTEAVEYRPRPVKKPSAAPDDLSPEPVAPSSTAYPDGQRAPAPLADEEFEPPPFRRVRERRSPLRILIDFLIGR